MLTRHLTLHKNLRYIAFSAFFILFLRVGSAQIVLNNATPNQMVANLVGPGIIYSNVTFTGNPAIAAGIFTNGASSNLGMNSGVVLTCGSINLIPGNNSGFEGVDNTGSAIPELNIIAGATTFDGVILEFDFIPLSPTINVNYIFGSEEYNEFVNSGYNDAFAFFISGPGIPAPVNIATVGGLPVTIDNINSFTNPGFFVNNENNFAANAIEYDGFTTTLTATRTVIPCSTYHIKLMIADGGDPIYDSGVFIQENGLFAAGNVTQVAVQPAYNFGTGIEGCLGSQFVFTMPFTPTVNTTFNYTVGGTATPGQDYIPIPNSVTIPAGQTTATVPVTIINDGIAEGAETITLTIQTSPCSTETFTLTINDPTPLSVNPTGNSFCQGQGPVNISAVPNGGNGTISLAWNNGAGNGSPVSVNPANTTVYTVTATDQCGQTATANATVTVTPPPTSTFTVNSPICQGSSSNFTYTGNAGVGATYNWNFGGGSASPGGQVQGPHSVTFPGSGTYNASLTVTQNGCTSGTTNQSVTVNPSPAGPVLGSNSPVCLGNSINLTANTIAGASYFWSGPNGFSSNSEDPVIANASSAMSGTYSAYTVVAGCTSATSTINVLVNPSPAAPVLGSNAPICQGSTLNLTANTIPGASYYWTGPAAFASNLEDPSIANSTTAMSGTYNAYVVIAGCTSSTSNLNVLINPLPASPLIASNTPVCEGSTLNLTANTIAGAGYFWSGPNAFASNLEDPSLPNASLLMDGNYSAYVVVSGCTSAVSNTTVTINPIPAAPVLASNSPICEGETLNLSANTVAGASYNWSGPNGYVSNLEDPSIANATPIMNGSYDAYIVENGCTSTTSTIQVVINPTPAAPVINSNSPACLGTDINLSADNVAGASYFWTGPNAYTSNDEDPVIANADLSMSGNYDAYIVVNSCTSATSSIAVSVNDIPTSDFAVTPQICLGEDAFALYNGNAPANATYTWTASNGAVLTGSGQGPITILWNTAGIQTVNLTVGINGCQSLPTTQQINVIQTITPNAGPDQTLCSGSLIQVGAANQPAANYTWLTPNGITDPASENTSATWLNNGNTQITLTITLQAETQGCIATDDAEITVLPIPEPSIANVAAQCFNGNSFDFTAGGTYLPTATFDWTFTNGNPASSIAKDPQNINFLQPGTHDVTLVITQGLCVSEPATIQVNVVPGPTAAFSYQPGQGCVPLQVTFSNQSQPAGTPLTYQWNFGNGASSSDATPSTTYTEAGSYTVSLTVEDAVGCTSTLTQPNIINVSPAPIAGFSVNPMIIYIDEPFTNVYDGSLGGVSTWNYTLSNGAQYNIPNFSVNFADTGTYVITQTVTGEFGCSDVASLSVQVLPVSVLFIPNSFTPNGNDVLNNTFLPVGGNISEFKMYIFNRWGELVFTTLDINVGWNGKIRNSEKDAKQDVYVYRIDYLDHRGNAQQRLGNVTLIR